MNESLRLAARRARRGFTLVEMMVVITLIGLLAGATAVAVFHHFSEGQKKTTRIAARNLRGAASLWRGDHPAECPTPAALRDAKAIDRGASVEDAWGSPFVIQCEAEDVTVVSLGPDRTIDTPDDLREPPPV
jgi:general secretion pathway protein G